MYDFFTENPSYVVLAIALVIFAGLAIYLNRIDSGLSKLEKKYASHKREEGRNE